MCLEEELKANLCQYIRRRILWTHNVKCGKCDKTFVSESKLEIHVKFDHVSTDEPELNCTTCDFAFSTKKDFTIHLSGIQHNQLEKAEVSDYDIEDESDDEDFIDDCNFCGRILHSYDSLDSQQSKNIRCETCETCYHNEFQFQAHKNCEL